MTRASAVLATLKRKLEAHGPGLLEEEVRGPLVVPERRNEGAAQAVARVLDAPSPSHRIYNVVDDESPELATLFAAVGAPPPDGSDAVRARAFDALLDGERIRADLGFAPRFARLADADAAGA